MTLVERSWASKEEEEFKIDNRKCSRKDYYSFLGGSGFNSGDNYNIIEQGKITEICNMNDKELVRLIEDVSGHKKIEKRIEEIKKELKEANREK